MEPKLELTPIGVIRSPYREMAGTPIQPKFAAGVEGSVEVFEPYAAGLQDLEGFDRIWLIYWLDRAPAPRLKLRPYLDTVERGVFATRSPCRPNPIAMSCVALRAVDGRTLRIADLDVLDGTPLLDIKPYARRFDHFEAKRCGWLDGSTVEKTVADGRFER